MASTMETYAGESCLEAIVHVVSLVALLGPLDIFLRTFYCASCIATIMVCCSMHTSESARLYHVARVTLFGLDVH